ncbi:MAG: HD domain-containing protein [Proteobacteria bacterium]|nr:HD domain-containing protein [Pseudomonadota bacterium]MBU1610863.1 HD domain-containing protein [Pseudomonadota bacterium]
MVNNHLIDLKALAKKMAKDLPVAAFYIDHATEVSFSWDLFFNHPLVLKLQEDSLSFLYDDYMFGIEHSKKVAHDAAAIVLTEESGLETEEKRHLALLAQLAGLLHDVQREEDDHARRSADAVATILEGYPLQNRDIKLIATAISSHEDRTKTDDYPDPQTRLLCQALYDADKFRFGADIFSTTMWLYCDYESWSMAEIAGQFPKGISAARAVVNTLRTTTGKSYGPEIIGQGIGLGETMLRHVIKASKEG